LKENAENLFFKLSNCLLTHIIKFLIALLKRHKKVTEIYFSLLLSPLRCLSKRGAATAPNRRTDRRLQNSRTLHFLIAKINTTSAWKKGGGGRRRKEKYNKRSREQEPALARVRSRRDDNARTHRHLDATIVKLGQVKARSV